MDIYADRIDVNQFGPHNMLAALISECEHVNYLPKSNFNFKVCFSDNKDYNAVAYEIGKYSWTNMSFTCIKDIFHHALLLMGRPELLPDAGIEGAFEGTYRISEFDEPEILPYDDKYKQLVFYAGPDNPKRYQVAELIAFFGIQFLLFHELGHHIGGHIRYLSDQMGLTKLYASHNDRIDSNSKLYQMLETDADAIAMANLLESISTKIDFYSRQFLNHNAVLIPHCLMIALTIVFYLLPKENIQQYNLNTSRYLPRDVRFRLVLDILFEKLDNDYHSCRMGQSNSSLLNDFYIANSLLNELYQSSEKQHSIDINTGEYRTYYKNLLLPEWQNIRDNLAKYAVIHLPD